MKILIVTQYFWPESFRINDLAEGLSELGHEVTVLTGKPNYPSGSLYPGYDLFSIQHEHYGSVPIIRTPIIPRGKNSKIGLSLNYLSFAVMASLFGAFKRVKPDILFVYEPSPVTVCLPAIFLKKLTKAPILFWVQDLWPDSVVAVDAMRNKFVLNCLNKLVNFIYKRCDYILTASRAYFDAIKKYNISEDKLRYFPQTAESFYRPLLAASNTNEDAQLPKGFRIIFAGNLGVAQNIDVILGAADLLKNINDIKWIVIGDGSKRRWLQHEIIKRQLTETVFWLGKFPAEKMPHFFSVADVLLITLKYDTLFALTVPAKLQSYLACAKPIVAVLQGEGKRIIEEAEAGLVTLSDSPHDLAKTVVAMKNLSSKEREEMGLNGRKYFDKYFNRDMLLKNLEQWMNELKEKHIR